MEYASTDGFGNQLRSLRHALLIGWLLDRTVVIPSEYAHFEAVARGNCHTKNSSGTYWQAEIIRETNNLYRKNVMRGTYHSLYRLLDFTNVFKYVDVIDQLEFEEIREKLTIATVPYDCCTCQDTIWRSGSIPEPVPRKKVEYRSIKETLIEFNEELLIFGSVYFPANANKYFYDPFTYGEYPWELYLMSNLPYRREITMFGKYVNIQIRRKHKNAAMCVHLRAGDGMFKDDFEDTLGTTIKKVTALSAYSPTRPLILITDAIDLRRAHVFQEFGKSFEIIFTIEDFMDEVAATNKALEFEVDLLHYETMMCACTPVFFGHQNSTFSQRITYMIKHKFCSVN